MKPTFAYLGSDWEVGDAVATAFGESLLDAGYTESPDGEISFCWGQNRRRDERTIIFDLGYIDRAWDSFKNSGKYYQASIGKIGWLPENAPGDRAWALNTKLGARSNEDGPIVVCGQVPCDAQHGLSADELVDELKTILARNGLRPEDTYWRPHPQAEPCPTPEGFMPHTGDKHDVLHGAGQVVVYNSTLGLEALLAGRNVLCHPSAFYAKEANLWNDGFDSRQCLLHRVAYAQWTEGEIRSGECRDFILQHL